MSIDYTSPDAGQQVAIDMSNPAPGDVPAQPGDRQAPPAPQPQVQDPGPFAGSAYQPPDTTNSAPPAPPKPSIWKGILMGALQGAAAGSARDTHGMGTGSAIAAGLGAGVNQVLNVKPQQNAEIDQAKASTAVHYANLAKIQQDIHLMPSTKQEAALNDAAEQAQTMMKSGAITPLSDPSDLITAQKKLMDLHNQNPWAVYSVMPMRGADGTMQYSAVQFAKAPIQKDITLKGPDGKDITIPAGTAGEDVGKLYTQITAKKLDENAKTEIAKGNQGTRLKVQDLKNQGAVDVQNLKNEGAAARASTKPQDMVFGTSEDGSQVAGSVAELQAEGITNPVKLPGTEAQKVVVARQLIGPRNGLFDMVQDTIEKLDEKGELGVLASRWNEFKSGKFGSGPLYARLRSQMGLLSTALMQAHVGARGSGEMLLHFKDLADNTKLDPETLRSAVTAEFEYVTEKAMLSKAGRAKVLNQNSKSVGIANSVNKALGTMGGGPGQTAPTTGGAPLSFADWKKSQGGQ